MPNPTTITKAEALRRLAEWMGLHVVAITEAETVVALTQEKQTGRIGSFDPFADANHALVLQARLNADQQTAFIRDLLDPPSVHWPKRNAWKLLNATADQRTRAVCYVVLNAEVEE